ncbi:hypothetical protein M1555_02380 [Patescibacteria group bacterium]|nr:hypothetical protein [Patescibacteria group bacterium]
MGIVVEYNPDLALRDHSEFTRGRRNREECVPKQLTAGRVYAFAKLGQRNYWLMGEIPLLVTHGDQKLGLPIASIQILEATHRLRGGSVWTVGKYKVIEVYKPGDKTIHFNGFAKTHS